MTADTTPSPTKGPSLVARLMEYAVDAQARTTSGALVFDAARRIERLEEALSEIAEHPGPHADEAAWARVEWAREVLGRKE